MGYVLVGIGAYNLFKFQASCHFFSHYVEELLTPFIANFNFDMIILKIHVLSVSKIEL